MEKEYDGRASENITGEDSNAEGNEGYTVVECYRARDFSPLSL